MLVAEFGGNMARMDQPGKYVPFCHMAMSV